MARGISDAANVNTPMSVASKKMAIPIIIINGIPLPPLHYSNDF
jgi:hypothetical protein